MTPFRLRQLLVTLATVLLLAGCSSDDGDDDDPGHDTVDASAAPTDADPDEFCDLWEGFALMEPVVGEMVSGGKTDGTNWPEDLVAVGTPADVSDQERHGFEVVVETFDAWQGRSGFDDDEDLTTEEDQAWDAFYYDYLYRQCDPYGEGE